MDLQSQRFRDAQKGAQPRIAILSQRLAERIPRNAGRARHALSYQFASITAADAWLVLHANGTTNTPSNANAANIAHASLTLQTKATFSIIGRT
jgi:hypothetical protein